MQYFDLYINIPVALLQLFSFFSAVASSFDFKGDKITYLFSVLFTSMPVAHLIIGFGLLGHSKFPFALRTFLMQTVI